MYCKVTSYPYFSFTHIYSTDTRRTINVAQLIRITSLAHILICRRVRFLLFKKWLLCRRDVKMTLRPSSTTAVHLKLQKRCLERCIFGRCSLVYRLNSEDSMVAVMAPFRVWKIAQSAACHRRLTSVIGLIFTSHDRVQNPTLCFFPLGTRIED